MKYVSSVNIFDFSKTFFFKFLSSKNLILQATFYLFKKKVSPKLKIITELTKSITEFFI